MGLRRPGRRSALGRSCLHNEMICVKHAKAGRVQSRKGRPGPEPCFPGRKAPIHEPDLARVFPVTIQTIVTFRSKLKVNRCLKAQSNV